MSQETATAISDIALSLGTFALALTVGQQKTFRTWTALFFMLALAAALGAVYRGVGKFHTKEFWVLVSTTTVSSAFLFLSACLCVARPNWKWLHWLWPLAGTAGLLLGGQLAPFPFWYLSIVSGICLFLSLLVLQKSPSRTARNWIYCGIIATILGLVVQKTTHIEGILSHNSLFHFLQLAGNVFFWVGARKV
jgi:hypothetical protein